MGEDDLKKKTLIYWGLLVFVALSFVRCGETMAPVSKKVKYPNEVSSGMRSEFDQAEGFYRRRQLDEAAQLYSRYIQSYPYNRLTDESLYKLGKIHFLKAEYFQTISQLQKLAEQTPDPKYQAKALHMAGYAAYKQNQPDQTIGFLKQVQPEALPSLLRMQYYSLLINVNQYHPIPTDLYQLALVQLYELYEEQGMRARALQAPDIVHEAQLTPLLEAWIAEPMSSSDIPSWMTRIQSGPAKALVDFKIAKTFYEEQKYSKAKKLLSAFVENYPKNSYYDQAYSMLKQLGGSDPKIIGERFKVGVLAPLSGAQLGFGEAVLRGVKCAATQGGTCEGVSAVDLVVKDAGYTPDMVRSQLQQLKGEGVSAVISILPGSMAQEAAITATESQVPLFIVSQQEGLMNQGSSVFQMGITPQRQVQELVRAALNRGMKNFAVFKPNIAYGKKMAALFNSEVQAQGGRVVAEVTYNRQNPDLFTEARRMKTDLKIAQALPDEESPNKVDAIFIPDTYQIVNNLAVALQHHGVANIPLLGTNTWNDVALSPVISEHFPGSFFVDVYDVSVSGGEAQHFKQKYHTSYGSDPQVLNALGYDAMMMVRSAVSSEGAENLHETLQKRFGYKGVTGITGFKPGEEPIIKAKVVPVKRVTGSLAF